MPKAIKFAKYGLTKAGVTTEVYILADTVEQSTEIIRTLVEDDVAIPVYSTFEDGKLTGKYDYTPSLDAPITSNLFGFAFSYDVEGVTNV